MNTNLEDLSREDLLFVTNYIISGGTLEEALEVLLPVKTRDLINSFHSLFCTSTHKGEGSCDFYNEKDFTGKYHTKWGVIVNEVISKFDEYENVEDIISDIIQYLWRVEGIKKQVEKEVAVGGLAIFNYLLYRTKYYSDNS
jgi:hypothetical protein